MISTKAVQSPGLSWKCFLKLALSSERINKHCEAAIVVDNGVTFLRSFFKNATKNGGNERSFTALKALFEVSLWSC